MAKSAEVDAWLAAYENPMKPVVVAIRNLVLSREPRLAEAIKWQAPTFLYEGNVASFFPRAKQHASLMFHKGASIPESFPNLEGDGAEARSFRVSDLDDLAAKADELVAIFTAWCDMMDR